jgi:hypothetical protein
VTFSTDTIMNFNVFQAAATFKLNPVVAAADTAMNRPPADLLAEVFPGVPLTHDVGEFGTLLAIDRARQILNFTPTHS